MSSILLAWTAGIAAHCFYFRRGEHHMYPVKYMQAFFITCMGSVFYLSTFGRVSRTEAVSIVCALEHDGEGTGKDITGWLLKAYTGEKHPEADPMLQGDARLIIVAGSDTTSATLTYLFFHLAKSPEQVERLRQELRPLTTDDWSDKDIQHADHLNGAISEALRLHPPVPSGLYRVTPPEGMHVGAVYIPGDVTFFAPQ